MNDMSVRPPAIRFEHASKDFARADTGEIFRAVDDLELEIGKGELVGATGGVGYQLLQQQQLFDMAGALAWTLQLVLFVLIMQRILSFIETVAFRYRAVSERSL